MEHTKASPEHSGEAVRHPDLFTNAPGIHLLPLFFVCLCDAAQETILGALFNSRMPGTTKPRE